MKPYRWNSQENEQLKAERGVSFEHVVIAIGAGGLLDILAHPSPAKYPRQRILVVAFDGYAHLVPFIEEDDCFFLKTIIPSRKASRDYLKVATMIELDVEEREILVAFENDAPRSVAAKTELATLKAAARATALKDKRVNIRLSSSDLSDIQVRALQDGVPYQTLIASVLHKYVTGRLTEGASMNPVPARRHRTKRST